MRRLALLALVPVMLCGFIGVVGSNPNPLTFWWYATSGIENQDKARRAIECAASRWRAAGVPVDISFDAHHWVRFREPEAVPGGWAHISGSWASTRIQVRNDQSDHDSCQMLVHEMSHALRASNYHPCSGTEPRSISESPTSFASAVITSCDLEAVCAVRACTAINPEG